MALRSFTLPLAAGATRLSTVYQTPPLGAYAAKVIADGASNYWRLGETSGLTAVDVVGGATGTISGGVTLGQPGAIADGNTAMTFDGATGKIVTATVDLPLVVTVELWLKVGATVPDDSPAVSHRASGTTGDWLLCGVNGGKPMAYGNSGAYGSRIIADGLWHHVVYQHQTAGSVRFYVDSILDGPYGVTPRAVPSVGILGIGYEPLTNRFWPGALDDVAIYPRALTAAEIAAHYALGLTAAAPILPSAAAADIPYRQLVLQAAGGTAYVGSAPSVTPATGTPITTTPTRLGPFRTGPVKLSDLYAVGAGTTLSVLGVPF